MIRKRLNYSGGSLNVIIPKPFADLMGLEPGSMVELDYESVNKKLIIQPAADKKNNLKQSSEIASLWEA